MDTEGQELSGLDFSDNIPFLSSVRVIPHKVLIFVHAKKATQAGRMINHQVGDQRTVRISRSDKCSKILRREPLTD